MARGQKDYEKAVIAVESEGFVDPHGRILMHDDFEDTPFKWMTLGAGTHLETRQAAAAYNGSFGLRLDATAPLPPPTAESEVYRRILIGVTERISSELFWRSPDEAQLQYFVLQQLWYDGANCHIAIIRYNRANAIWEYEITTGNWIPIAGSEQTLRNDAWNELTFDADFGNDVCIRIKTNNREVNLQDLPIRTIVSGVGAHLVVHLRAVTDTGAQLLIDIDDIVIKELER